MAKTKNLPPLVTWALDPATITFPDSDEPGQLTSNQKSIVQKMLANTVSRLSDLAFAVDPIKLPKMIFNPSDPSFVAQCIGLALLAQPRYELSGIPQIYGSGIYAIYYKGDFKAYEAISGAEHPIYVGKATPSSPDADSPKAQGPSLVSRLSEHARSIERANNINLKDFECRFLVISSGWQESAETFLKHLYAPIWNKETEVCYGIGKHGDSATTRANNRSPWDTLHTGRPWAEATIKDQRSVEEIVENLEKHFKLNPPIQTIDDAVERFFNTVRPAK
jgi:hypothetical protein